MLRRAAARQRLCAVRPVRVPVAGAPVGAFARGLSWGDVDSLVPLGPLRRGAARHPQEAARPVVQGGELGPEHAAEDSPGKRLRLLRRDAKDSDGCPPDDARTVHHGEAKASAEHGDVPPGIPVALPRRRRGPRPREGLPTPPIGPVGRAAGLGAQPREAARRGLRERDRLAGAVQPVIGGARRPRAHVARPADGRPGVQHPRAVEHEPAAAPAVRGRPVGQRRWPLVEPSV
mmetsp:Transcript_67998/g.176935  ORF Transcript_67998/g.176935 Transcript_67998/m.176935 type:complete len:232 (-) Transcript_67998:196-891(-)